jgi:hypothetical protein
LRSSSLWIEAISSTSFVKSARSFSSTAKRRLGQSDAKRGEQPVGFDVRLWVSVSFDDLCRECIAQLFAPTIHADNLSHHVFQSPLFLGQASRPAPFPLPIARLGWTATT